ncbi:Uncharacterised protein [Vibrio cholerae]|nr:Uncharacterised protein [Vibrio cholerae]
MLARSSGGQISDDFAGRIHADIGNQQLFFELFEQVIINLFAFKQAKEASANIRFGAAQTAL